MTTYMSTFCTFPIYSSKIDHYNRFKYHYGDILTQICIIKGCTTASVFQVWENERNYCGGLLPEFYCPTNTCLLMKAASHATDILLMKCKSVLWCNRDFIDESPHVGQKLSYGVLRTKLQNLIGVKRSAKYFPTRSISFVNNALCFRDYSK